MRSLLVLMMLSAALVVSAQAPQARFTYEDRSGTTGHTLVVDGKSYGPYKDVTSVVHSNSAATGMFLVTKRDKTYVVAQGKEWGPLGAGYEVDQTAIADDGKVWAVTGTHYEEAKDDGDGTSSVVLMVNGKSYGPYQEVSGLTVSDTGGHWMATVKLAEDSYDLIFDGKNRGPFQQVGHSWLSADGKLWGWSATIPDAGDTVVTQDKEYDNVQSSNFDQMDVRAPHWGYSVRIGDEEEVVVVDGKTYPNYLNFSGLYLSYSGRHWGFTADKMSDAGDFPVVVIDGKEYVGEGLGTAQMGDKELYTWSVTDGNKVTVQVLTLP